MPQDDDRATENVSEETWQFQFQFLYSSNIRLQQCFVIEYTNVFCFKFIVKLQDLLHIGVEKLREDWSFILTYI
jgi:hypothetical protein